MDSVVQISGAVVVSMNSDSLVLPSPQHLNGILAKQLNRDKWAGWNQAYNDEASK